jgi:hypothetical protein
MSMHALMHESVRVLVGMLYTTAFTSYTPPHLHSLALLLASARALSLSLPPSPFLLPSLSLSLSRGVAARSLQGKDGVCGGGGLVEG